MLPEAVKPLPLKAQKRERTLRKKQVKLLSRESVASASLMQQQQQHRRGVNWAPPNDKLTPGAELEPMGDSYRVSLAIDDRLLAGRVDNPSELPEHTERDPGDAGGCQLSFYRRHSKKRQSSMFGDATCYRERRRRKWSCQAGAVAQLGSYRPSARMARAPLFQQSISTQLLVSLLIFTLCLHFSRATTTTARATSRHEEEVQSNQRRLFASARFVRAAPSSQESQTSAINATSSPAHQHPATGVAGHHNQHRRHRHRHAARVLATAAPHFRHEQVASASQPQAAPLGGLRARRSQSQVAARPAPLPPPQPLDEYEDGSGESEESDEAVATSSAESDGAESMQPKYIDSSNPASATRTGNGTTETTTPTSGVTISPSLSANNVEQPTGTLLSSLFSHIDKQWKFAEVILVIVISVILNLVTIIGNIMVLISFKMDRSLQTVSNYFLLSLALADLLIGLISMPLYTLYLLLNYWPLGPLMCDIWLAIDYLNSNAAVLNMLIISFDRYFSVTRPLTYRAKRTTKHACLMISCAWILSLTIWTPAIFTYPYYKGRTVQGTDKCEIEFVKANTYLTFVTAILAFYIPVIIMIYLYWRIWLETKKRYRDLTTLFLVSGVGAAAPARPNRPLGGGGGPSSVARQRHQQQQRQQMVVAANNKRPLQQPPLAIMPAPSNQQVKTEIMPSLGPTVGASGEERPPQANLTPSIRTSGSPDSNQQLAAFHAIDGMSPKQSDSDQKAIKCKCPTCPRRLSKLGSKTKTTKRSPKEAQKTSACAGPNCRCAIKGTAPAWRPAPTNDQCQLDAAQFASCSICLDLQPASKSQHLRRDSSCHQKLATKEEHGQQTAKPQCDRLKKHHHHHYHVRCNHHHHNHHQHHHHHPNHHTHHHHHHSHRHGHFHKGHCDNPYLARDKNHQIPDASTGSHDHLISSNGKLSLITSSYQALSAMASKPHSGSGSMSRKVHPGSDERQERSEGESCTSLVDCDRGQLLAELEQKRASSAVETKDTASSPIRIPSAADSINEDEDDDDDLERDFETLIVSSGDRAGFRFESDTQAKSDNHHLALGSTLLQSSCKRSTRSPAIRGNNRCCYNMDSITAPALTSHLNSSPARKHEAPGCAECKQFAKLSLHYRHHNHNHRHRHKHQRHHNHRHHQHRHARRQETEQIEEPTKEAAGQRDGLMMVVSPAFECDDKQQVASNEKLPILRALQGPDTNPKHNSKFTKEASGNHLIQVEWQPAKGKQGSARSSQSTCPGGLSARKRLNNGKKFSQKLTFSDILVERRGTHDQVDALQGRELSEGPAELDDFSNANSRFWTFTSLKQLFYRPFKTLHDKVYRRSDASVLSHQPEVSNQSFPGDAADRQADGALDQALACCGRRANARRCSSGDSDEQVPRRNGSSSNTENRARDQYSAKGVGGGSSSSVNNSNGSGYGNSQKPSYSSHHPIQPKSERKAAKTLSTLLLVFIVTWLPYNILVLIKTLSGGEDQVPEKIWNFSYYLCYINSTINPLCYALCNAQFRRTYMRILKCKLSNEPHNSTRRLVPLNSSTTWNKDLRLRSDATASSNPTTTSAASAHNSTNSTMRR